MGSAITAHLPQPHTLPVTAASAPPAAAPGPRQDLPTLSRAPSAPCAAPDNTGGRCPTTYRRGRQPNSPRTAAAGPDPRPRRWAYLPRPNTPRTRPAATTPRP